MKALDSMWQRVDAERLDSDASLLNALMYLGEQATKIAVCGVVAAIEDPRARYSLLHRLVRADGLGEWTEVLNDALQGPSSSTLSQTARDDQRALIQRVGVKDWQHEFVTSITKALGGVDNSADVPGTKATAYQGSNLFVRLRNKTRGHGAPNPEHICSIGPDLEVGQGRSLVSFRCSADPGRTCTETSRDDIESSR